MISGTVKYWDVGRNDGKGHFKFKCYNQLELTALIIKTVSVYLMSSQVDIDDKGNIVVGGYRDVGKYKVDFDNFDGDQEAIK